MGKNKFNKLIIYFVILAAVPVILLLINKIDIEQAINILLLLALVFVTGIYAVRTAEIAGATRKQAEEIKEQRIMASRPVIIQRAVYEQEVYGSTSNHFHHFEVYNAGNGPAIEIEISLLNEKKDTSLKSIRKTFLRAGQPPTELYDFQVSNLEEHLIYYFTCEYQGISSRVAEQKWYQTWLPFEVIKSSEEHKIWVKPGELEFKEVTESDRIDAFSRKDKPK